MLGLALAAETECAMSLAGRKRPYTAGSSGTEKISQYLDPLLEAIQKDRDNLEEAWQARICVGWIHWALGHYESASTRLPKDIEADFALLDESSNSTTLWTKVCAVKGAYVKGNSQLKLGMESDALQTYESAMPILSAITNSRSDVAELRTWKELLLTDFSMLSAKISAANASPYTETETLGAFRAWSKLWESGSGLSLKAVGGNGFDMETSRRSTWKAYYWNLSSILQRKLPYPTTALVIAHAEASSRLQQRAELARVEAAYEGLLLKEVQFPRAEESSEEVEEWVDMVMQNWRILCGSDWQEHDLGEGGREAVSRNVLDILYRAATKTFHSTAILRHLFTVHLAVADFDLAFKAYDTYLEIVQKGQARVEKSGEAEPGLDDNDMILRTTASCIKALCQYGNRSAAEKARDMGRRTEDWLHKHSTGATHNVSNGDAGPRHNETLSSSTAVVSSQAYAVIWQSIGLGQAQWAKHTYDHTARAALQAHAIECLEKSLSPEFHDEYNVESLFALGILHAECQDLEAAIDVVKTALSTNSSHGTQGQSSDDDGNFSTERALIPCWHLLALLLSAQQDFETATKACEGAFEQFQDPTYLFGNTEQNQSYQSEHLNGSSDRLHEKHAGHSRGLVDDMDDLEKETILEIKMTQMSLMEVMEGPEAAVNASDELLALYARLFSNPQPETSRRSPPQTRMAPPKSSASTLRSIKGSLFGRSRHSVRKTSQAQRKASVGTIDEKSGLSSRPQTGAPSTGAPTIHVTDESESRGRQHHHSILSHIPHHHHEKLQKRQSSLVKKKSLDTILGNSKATQSKTLNGASSSPAREPQHLARGNGFESRSEYATPQEMPEGWPLNVSTKEEPGMATLPVRAASTQELAAHDNDAAAHILPAASQNMSQEEEPIKHSYLHSGTIQDTRLSNSSSQSSSTSPSTRFTDAQQRRRRTSVLVHVWLFVAGLYRRAGHVEDATGAATEAQKLVESLETDVMKDTNGSVRLEYAGWGGGKSVDELWGDVWSEVWDPSYMHTSCGLTY